MAKILIVDDDNVSLEYVQMILEPLNHQLTLTNDSCEARDKLELDQFDMIITDIIMEHSGINFIQYLSTINWKKPIIVITGSLIAATALRENISVSEIFIKPYKAEYLISKIQDLLQ